MADGSWSYPPSLFPDILRCFLIAAAEGPRGVNYGDSCLAGTPEEITELEGSLLGRAQPEVNFR